MHSQRRQSRWTRFAIALVVLVVILFLALEWQEFVHLRLQRFG